MENRKYGLSLMIERPESRNAPQHNVESDTSSAVVRSCHRSWTK
jgi:hypothetical protein